MILNANKPVYYFESHTPKDIYTYPLWVRKFAIPNIVMKFTMPFLVLILIAQALLAQEHRVRICLELLFCLLVYIVLYLILPYCRKKRYEKIKEAGEDRFACTFERDSVRVVSPSEDIVLLRSDVERVEEVASFFYIRFYSGRLLCIDKAQCNAEEKGFLCLFAPTKTAGIEHNHQKEIDVFLSALLFFVYIIFFFVQICFLGQVIKTNVNQIQSPGQSFSLFHNQEESPERNQKKNAVLHDENQQEIPIRFPEKPFSYFESKMEDGKVKNIEIVGEHYIEYTVQEQETEDSEPKENRYYSLFDKDPAEVNNMAAHAVFTPYPNQPFTYFQEMLEKAKVKNSKIISEHLIEYTVQERESEDSEPEEKQYASVFYQDPSEVNEMAEGAFYTPYPEKPFSFFESKLNIGKACNIKVTGDRYIEYTVQEQSSKDLEPQEKQYYSIFDKDPAIVNDMARNAFYTPYPETSFVNFEKWVGYRKVKEVTVTQERFVEFTVMNDGADSHYYFIYSGSKNLLNWLIDLTKYSASTGRTSYSEFLRILDSARVIDAQITADNCVNFTYAAKGGFQRMYAAIEEPVSDLEQKIADAYYSPYPLMSYEEFFDYLQNERIKNVEIIKDHTIEFSLYSTQNDGRFCTINPDDITHLTGLLDKLGIKWTSHESESPDFAA